MLLELDGEQELAGLDELLDGVEWLEVELLLPCTDSAVVISGSTGMIGADLPLFVLHVHFSSSLNFTSLLIITLPLMGLYSLYALDWGL